MTFPFQPLGPSGVIAYADDSTDTSQIIEPGSTGLPNALYIVNADTANVVVVGTSFNAEDTNAVVPTSGFNGTGTVVGPMSSALIRLESTYVQGNIYVSAAGVSGTGNVYITPGTI
jgi:hypothetical protein